LATTPHPPAHQPQAIVALEFRTTAEAYVGGTASPNTDKDKSAVLEIVEK